MSMLYSTGRYANVLTRGTVSVYPTASTVAPLANLYDGDPSSPMLAGSLVITTYISFAMDYVTNGTFESGSAGAVPTGWTDASNGGGTPYVTTTAGEFRTGSKAVKLTAGGGAAWIYRTVTARAGEWMRARAWARYVAAGSAKFHVYNVNTGHYWDGLTWGSSAGFVAFSALTGSFAASNAVFQVESFDDCRSDIVTLRIGLYCNSGVACVDDFSLVSGIDSFALFGHNLGPISCAVTSTEDGAQTTRATPTIKRPSFFSTFTRIYAPTWTVYLDGPNHETPYIGELWLGQLETAAFGPEWGVSVDFDIPAARNVTSLGNASVKNYSVDATRSLSLPFAPSTAAGAKELVESLWLRSGQGRYPTIIVPSDTETAVYHGRLLKPVSQSRVPALYPMSLFLQGSPFPTVGA